MSDFGVRVERTGGSTTVFLQGELDMATVSALEHELEGVEGRVCFDCTALTFVDSSGLAVFAKVDRNGGAMLNNVQANVRRVVEVVGLDRLITHA